MQKGGGGGGGSLCVQKETFLGDNEKHVTQKVYQ